MKRFLLLIISTFIFCVVYFYNSDTKYIYTITDCLESGVCKEGLNVIVNDNNITITKEYCLSNFKKWNDIDKTCYIR